MAVIEAEIEKYICMVDEMQAAKDFAAEGNIDRAMVSAAKSSMLFKVLKQTGVIDEIAGNDSYFIRQIPADFVKEIAAEAYLSAAEAALKEGKVRNAQLSHWLILPGAELRRHLGSERLSERAKRLDNLLSAANRKYFK